MRFPLPDGTSFEIPDEWWRAAAMESINHHPIKSYRFAPGPRVSLMEVGELKAPRRNPDTTLDFGGFNRDRLLSIFDGFRASALLPPIEIYALAGDKCPYGIYDGFHRFYASIAAGYKSIPTIVVRHLDLTPS